MSHFNRILRFSFLLQFLLFQYLLAGTVTLIYNGSIAKDARITSAAPGFNGGNDIWGNVTYFTSNDNIERTYFQLEIPSFITPEIANTITSSVFKVYFSGLQSGPFSISLNEVTSSWEENNICWTIRPQHNLTPEDTLTLNQENVWVEFNITNLVINWISGEKYNYGFLLKPLIEYPPVQDLTMLWTSDYPDSSFRPILEITSPELPDTVVTWIITSFEQDNLIEISNFQLSQNYPNPFNPKTNIEFVIGESQNVKISIYNMLGEEKEVLLNSYQQAGKHRVVFDGTNYSSGVYFYKINTGKYSQTKKLVLLK